MMKSFLQSVILTLVYTSLTGCDGKPNDSDYLQHPQQLQVLVSQCQLNPPTSPEQALKCKDILYAAKEVLNVIDHVQTNPQQFGEHLLRSQMQYAVQVQLLQDLDWKIKSIQAQPASLESKQQLQLLQEDSNKTKAASEQLLRKINSYLAVLGLASPE